MKVKVTQSCPTLCDPMDYTRTTCGWHHQLDRHEFEQALRVGDGQGSLACCSTRGLKESGMTGWLNWTGLYSPWNSLSQNTGAGSCSLFQVIFPNQGLNQGLQHCRWILYQLRHKRSPRNTGVGSLSLLQWIFPAQGLNQGVLYCRWILYQLSYLGSPFVS